MRHAVLTIAVVAVILRPSIAAEEESRREWRSRDGKTTVSGTFWRVEKGVVEIKTADKDAPLKVNVADLSAEDVTYLLRNDGGVVHSTTRLLLSGYVMDKDKTVMPLTKHHRQFSGTVQSKFGNDLMIVGDLERKIVVSCNAASYKTGARFSGWVIPLKETLSMPDGKTSRVYRGYVALGNPKEITKMLREAPLRFAKYVTGSSADYRAWVKEQENLRKVVAAEQRQTEKVRERAEARTKEVEKRTEARLEEEKVKQTEMLKRKVAAAETKIKTLESNIKTWEARKRNSKMHSQTYNRMRKRIGEAEHEVVLLKRNLREYTGQLKALGEK